MSQQLSDNAIKKWLWELGHFRNPAYPQQAQQRFLPHYSMDHEVVRNAVASYQGYMAHEFDRLCAECHGRPGIVDGVVGPATRELLQIPRCGYPDFGFATGNGSWPVGCHPDWPDNHAFTVNMDFSGMPSYLDGVIEEAWDLCQAAYADIGIVFIREDGNRNANTTVTWTRGSGWIGLAIVPSNPRCRDRIWAKFDNRYRPSALLDQWARLLAHEFGHNMGMGHSRGGIMNPSIISGTFEGNEWRGDPSEPILRRYFGGEPVDLDPDDDDEPDPPGPPDPPVDGPLRIRGDIEIWDSAGEFHGTYNLTPVSPPEF